MPIPELHPTSIDRVTNRLTHAIKDGPTETFRELHSKVLKRVEAMEQDLAALADPITKLEDAYAWQDDQEQVGRKRVIKTHNANSKAVTIHDMLHEANLALRLPARNIALAISKQMDKAFENYLDGGVSAAELLAVAEAGLGVIPGTEPLTVGVEIFRRIDAAIDPLEAQRKPAEQYALKLEIFLKVIAGFADRLRELQDLAETRLQDFKGVLY